MQTTEKIWHNGQLIPWDDAKVHVLSHTLHYGGGAFEGIRFYKTDKGSAIFRLSEHIDRLIYSAQVLKMKIPFSKEEMMNAVVEVAKASKLEEGYIRPLIFYGYGKMGVSPIGSKVELIVACWPWGAYLPAEGVDIKTSSFIRIHPASTQVEAKLCGHYVNSILASLEIQGTKYHEALFLDSDGNISEGVGENFFMVKNGEVFTPPKGTILPGITRDTVIQLCNYLSIPLKEKNIRLDEAIASDEAFFTGTAAEVTPIHSIDDQLIGKAGVGPITTKLRKAYFDLVYGQNPEFQKFLTYI